MWKFAKKGVKMPEKLVRFSFSFPSEIQEKLKKIAEKQNRSLPALVKIILNDYLKKQEEKVCQQ